ncbi:MAG: glycosyltransferase [Bacilli bacterium]|nr:glycosyltransferase [Bacilli bacterium]
MKRILVGYATNGNNSGINKYLFNFIKQVKANNDIKIDVLSSDVGNVLKLKMKELNCTLYEIPSLKHPIKRYKAICEIINKNKYDITYSNISESFNCCLDMAARKCKVPRIVVHSHSTKPSGQSALVRKVRTVINNIFKRKLHKCCTEFVACSKEAGEWLFLNKDVNSKKFHVINNTIEFKDYYYDEKKRKKFREEYKISNNDIVLGNIGNFEYQKNQMFLLKMLKELLNENNNYKLMLIGTGSQKDEFKEYIKENNMKDKVIFTGVINNVHEVLNAMDVFLFPSMFEGFGIVALEAQVNGLPTVISEYVPKMVKVSKEVYQLPLDMNKWMKKTKELAKLERTKANLNEDAYQYDNSNIEQFKYIIGDDKNE